ESDAAVRAGHADRPRCEVELGVVLAGQFDFGVLEHGEAIAMASPQRPQVQGAEAGVGLAAGDEAGAGSIDLGPPAIMAIGLVEDVSCRRLDRYLTAEADVTVEGRSDRLAVGNV